MSTPPTDAAVIALVNQALIAARARNRVTENHRNENVSSDGHPGITLDASRRDIARIPQEVIALIKDEIERLALAHNRLTSFADEFSGLVHLRYLNLRANYLQEFPLVLTRLPSLEILDVSRNQLTSLPPSFGSLMSLKILSISKNQISVLPSYIGFMPDLKILKSYHNPIVFPPPVIMERETDAVEHEAWLAGVQQFLRRHAEKMQTGSSSPSSFEEDGIQNESSFSSSLTNTIASSASPATSNDSSSENSDTVIKSTGTTTHPETTRLPAELLQSTMAPSPLRARSVSPSQWPLPQQQLSTNVTATILLASASSSPGTLPESNMEMSQLERSRSQSESAAQLQTIRGNRRMGMLPPSRKPPSATVETPASGEALRTVVEQHHHTQQHQQHPKTAKHQRGYSHDSIITTVNSVKMHKPSDGPPPRHSPTENARQPGPYFRRLSSLPEHKRSTLTSARVAEAARGILYAMSTLQRPIEQYVQSAVDPNGPHHKVERALYNGNIHIGHLVGALEAYEEKVDGPTVEAVIDASCSCVAAFRQVLAMLQSSSKEMGSSGAGPDVRYMRTLLLTVYGSYVEIQSSYEILRPLLPKRQGTVPGGGGAIQSGAIQREVRGRQPLQSGNLGQRLKETPPASLASSPYSTPRGGTTGGGGPATDYFSLPPTPGLGSLSSRVSQTSEGGFETDEPLYGTFQAAIGAALSTLPVIEKEIKVALGQSLQPSTTLKLKQIASLCMAGTEAARRLGKVRWEAIQEGEVGERRRFWEDTNRFTNLVVNMAELIKSTHQEYSFRKHTLAAVGAVVRPTKDLYILMNGNSFRMYSAESSTPQQPPPSGVLSASQFGFQSMVAPQTWLAATPLSAALGPAAQATLPLGMYYPSPGLGGGGGGSGSVPGSRSATLMSMVHPTMNSVLGGMGGMGGIGGMGGMGGMSLPGTPGEGPGSGLGLGLGIGRAIGVGGVAVKMG